MISGSFGSVFSPERAGSEGEGSPNDLPFGVIKDTVATVYRLEIPSWERNYLYIRGGMFNCDVRSPEGHRKTKDQLRPYIYIYMYLI